jgi:dynein heavy chain
MFENLEKLREDFFLRATMWRSLKQWEELTDQWVNKQFQKIDAKEIANQAEKFSKTAIRVDNNLPDNPISKKLKHLVETFKGAMPIVTSLRNDNLKEHHWREIKDLIGSDFDINEPDFTLNSLISLNAVAFMEEITQISTQASQEAFLKSQINALEEQWKRIDFLTKQYKDKDAFILDEIEDIFQSLDESLATINIILGSRFVKPLRIEAEAWKKNLFTLNQMVEEWIKVQRQWIYLENIFSAPDIRRQLPNESTRFDNVDELLEILANSNNLEVIQQSLRTCFDNIVKLDIFDSTDINAMVSSEGERVAFFRP